MYIVHEIQVINELSPYPEYISNYQVLDNNGDVELTTTSEGKAYDRAHSLNSRADIRDM